MQWIKERRKKLGLTQSDLAAKLQVLGHSAEISTISSWETDKSRPPLADVNFLNALSIALKLDNQTILRLSGLSTQSHSPLAERAAAIVETLPDYKKQIAVKILESLME